MTFYLIYNQIIKQKKIALFNYLMKLLYDRNKTNRRNEA